MYKDEHYPDKSSHPLEEEWSEKVFVIYDCKAQSYSTPYIDFTAAFEQFLTVMVNTHVNQPMHTHPEDFVIYKIGEYSNGKLTVYEDMDREIMGTLMAYHKKCKWCTSEDISLTAHDPEPFLEDDINEETQNG